MATKPARRTGPRSGDVVYVGPAASPQFRAVHSFRFRVVRIHDWPASWEGWAWLDGYQLTSAGDAVERRSIYVDLSGLRPTDPPSWQ